MKFDNEYLTAGMMYMEMKAQGDEEAAAIYNKKIEDYLDTHQFACPARELMEIEANRLNNLTGEESHE